MEINIDMKKFVDKFSEYHMMLYDTNDGTDDFKEAVTAFDEAFKHTNFREFLRQFNDYREQLYISSDRECAAFMYTFNEFVTESLYGDDDNEEL